jgi:hypothetical protein
MSVVEDVRKVAQDLAASDLKAIAVKLEVMEAIAQARHNELLAKIETATTIETARYDAILWALDIERRLQRIEARQTA